MCADENGIKGLYNENWLEFKIYQEHIDNFYDVDSMSKNLIIQGTSTVPDYMINKNIKVNNIQGTTSKNRLNDPKINKSLVTHKTDNIIPIQYDLDTSFCMPNYIFSASNMKFLFLSTGDFIEFNYYDTPFDEIIYSYEKGYSPYTYAYALCLNGKLIQISVDRGREGGSILSYIDDNFWEKFKNEAKHDKNVADLYEKVKYKDVWTKEGLREINYGYDIKPFEIIKYAYVDNDEYAIVKDYRENFAGNYPYLLIHLNYTKDTSIDINLNEYVCQPTLEHYNEILDVIINDKLTYKEALKYIENECKYVDEFYYNLIKSHKIIQDKSND